MSTERKSMKTSNFIIPIFICLLCPAAILAQDFGDAVQTDMAERDYAKAFESAKRDARRGDPKAQGDLGLLYEKGLGTTQDDKMAAYWLVKAAQKGDAESENNLGYLYFNGHGVIQDYAQALKWFQKAADQGLASAQSNLGLIYGAGLGVPKDYSKALEFFQKSADQDDLDAQVNLGMMYSLAEGTSQNNITAYLWFYRALQHTFTDEDKKNEVRDDIQWMEKHMSNEDVATAKTKAMHWRPNGTQTDLSSHQP
jgi:TPR repeat protein